MILCTDDCADQRSPQHNDSEMTNYSFDPSCKRIDAFPRFTPRFTKLTWTLVQSCVNRADLELAEVLSEAKMEVLNEIDNYLAKPGGERAECDKMRSFWLRLPSVEQLERVHQQHLSVLFVVAILDGRVLRSLFQPDESITEAWSWVKRTHTSPVRYCVEVLRQEYFNWATAVVRRRSQARLLWSDYAGLTGIRRLTEDAPVPEVDYESILIDLEDTLESAVHQVFRRSPRPPATTTMPTTARNIVNDWSDLRDKWSLLPLAGDKTDAEDPGGSGLRRVTHSPKLSTHKEENEDEISANPVSPVTPSREDGTHPARGSLSPQSSYGEPTDFGSSGHRARRETLRISVAPMPPLTPSKKRTALQHKECQMKCMLISEACLDLRQTVDDFDISNDAWTTWDRQAPTPSPTSESSSGAPRPKKNAWAGRTAKFVLGERTWTKIKRRLPFTEGPSQAW